MSYAGLRRRRRLRSYAAWAGLNLAMGIVCFVAAAVLRHDLLHAAGHDDFLIVGMIVCGLALARTGVDCMTSDAALMFP